MGDGALVQQDAGLGVGQPDGGQQQQGGQQQHQPILADEAQGEGLAGVDGGRGLERVLELLFREGGGGGDPAGVQFHRCCDPFLQVELPVGEAGLLQQRGPLAEQGNGPGQQTGQAQAQSQVTHLFIGEQWPEAGRRGQEYRQQQPN